MGKKRAHGEGSITLRSDGRWQACVMLGYRRDGKPNRRYVYGKTQRAVKDKLERLKRAAADHAPIDSNKVTCEQFLQRWLEVKAQSWSARSRELNRYEVERYILPRLGRLPLNKLTPMHVERVQREVAAEVGARTALKCRTHLVSACKLALRWHLLARNPAELVEPVRVAKRDTKPIPADMLRAILEAARPHRLYALIALGCTTGLRRGELFGLRWADVEPTAIYVRQGVSIINHRPTLGPLKTKNARRRIPIDTRTHDVLMDHLAKQHMERAVKHVWEDHDLVFPATNGRLLNPSNWRRVWTAVLERAPVLAYVRQRAAALEQQGHTPQEAAAAAKAELEADPTTHRALSAKLLGTRLHDVRHTYASMMIRAGADPKLLAARMGHARASFTMDVYVELFEAQRDDLTMSLEDLLKDS